MSQSSAVTDRITIFASVAVLAQTGVPAAPIQHDQGERSQHEDHSTGRLERLAHHFIRGNSFDQPRKRKRGITFEQDDSPRPADTIMQHKDVPLLDLSLFRTSLSDELYGRTTRRDQRYSHLKDLPAEILLMSLEYCTTGDVVSMLRTCMAIDRTLSPHLDYLGRKFANQQRERIESGLRLLDFGSQGVDILTAMQYYAHALQLREVPGCQWNYRGWMHDFCRLYASYLPGSHEPSSQRLDGVIYLVKRLFWYRQLRQYEASAHSYLDENLRRYLWTLAEPHGHFLTGPTASQVFKQATIDRLLRSPGRNVTRTYRHEATSRELYSLFGRAGNLDLLSSSDIARDTPLADSPYPSWTKAFHVSMIGDATLMLPELHGYMYCSRGGHRPDRYAQSGTASRTPLLVAAILEDVGMCPELGYSRT
ncbi:hypothetical protein CLAFUW4_12088 [Fulvia fulva]|uniref:F-box domain-containing protein n=1 Tax=Passalora fulva TaxID=5499 RepID=A0A9Q8USC5_PASFU|nr:uncharacterized protein CLAFUR5_11127 [Fulvia fulva]KAK4617542.1 hypothetical protein CLAFUR4_12093 [Fulvia fulva]KAK4618941.1 hypothetical protein CLAFUR0_12104 [Fulvia fulva]UJO20694.1 hypothetical protein CLAFUR5_11127 [Fulvia fulva]WPV18298.1 hypothetical protein CLAFUW4_12088 [Fulvia fulva]WPV32872.1 hypothetical protein CLAFUW7_12095 [Fulvia fulva]